MKEKELQKGAVLKDRYRIEKILGQGGFSITYLATDERMNVPVTLKQYDMSKSLTGEEAKREAQIAAGFYDLEGIAAARDYFEEQGIFFIVMEYVDGVNITDFIRQHGSMAGRDVLEKIRPILHSLSRIHDKGVIHRDVSGDNLILSADGKLKLIDFGAARQQVQDSERSYTLIYKRGFAPVEQCRSHGVQGPWTDVYAVCSTMYFMLTGIVPDDAVDRMIHDRVRSLEDFAGTGLSREEAAVIMKGMAVEVKNRYASVRELYLALYDEEPGKEEHPAEANWTYRESRKKRRQNTTYLAREVEQFYRRKSRRRKYLPIAMFIIFLLAATGFFLLRGSGTFGRRPSAVSVTERPGNTNSPKPETVKLKNYSGKLQSAVQKELKRYQKEGLKLHIIKKYSTKKKGTILFQSPAAGSVYGSWKEVTLSLTVSKGKKPVPVKTSKPEQNKPSNQNNNKNTNKENSSNKNNSNKDDVTFHGSLS